MSGSIGFFFNLGGQELILLLVIGVLLFGRNLPEVGRTLGRTVAQLRRGFQEFKDQMDRDETVREVKDSVRDLKRSAQLPRAIANPGRLLQDLTDEALHSPAPEDPSRDGSGPAAAPDAAAR
jgi:Sec-independent protein translocase protein TatA